MSLRPWLLGLQGFKTSLANETCEKQAPRGPSDILKSTMKQRPSMAQGGTLGSSDSCASAS
uniref:Uncharacterized protein n=1 Tax=Macaca fascicularis TaxID=9541 RepID=A0A7N9CAZ9_MACFA